MLPPWGLDAAAAGAAGVSDATLAASRLANINTAAADAVAELEGGLVVGAELSRAPVSNCFWFGGGWQVAAAGWVAQ